MSPSDKIILSYEDSIIRESDISLLTGPFWLNGTIISFYFEYLLNECLGNDGRILMIGPEVTQCIKAGNQEEVPIFLDPLDAKRKDVIFFALNDNQIYDKSGGTHWSLIVYCRSKSIIYHLDSLAGSNFRQAGEISEKLFKYFGLLSSEKGNFEELACCQQSNGYDCGIFVLYFAELLASHFKQHNAIENCDVLSSSKTLLCLRNHVLETIQNLAHKV